MPKPGRTGPKTPIGPKDTLGTVYFDRLFPMGVKAMLEAADLVVAGKHKEVVQDESQATYEGWFRANEAKIHWHTHVDFIHDIIRGSDPAPGAWTTIGGKKLQLFGSRKHLVRTRRAGQSIYYSLSSGQAASIMHTLHEQFCRRG